MAKKTIGIKHPVPARLPYALIPCGTFLNVKLQEAAIGSEVEFQTDWMKDRRILVRKCRIPVKSPMFTFMLASLYGEYMTIKKLFEQWQAQCVLDGLGRNGFDKDSALLIEVRKLENYEL